MASQGPNSPAASANNLSFGSVPWADNENVVAEDGAVASATVDMGMPSNYLAATEFGFTIPAGATIDGILVEVKRRSDGLSDLRDARVRLIKGGTIQSTDKASASSWPGSLTYASYGGSADLWGNTWTAADINATDFGVAFAAELNGFVPPGGAEVDHIRITLYYTGAAQPVRKSAVVAIATPHPGWIDE